MGYRNSVFLQYVDFENFFTAFVTRPAPVKIWGPPHTLV